MAREPRWTTGLYYTSPTGTLLSAAPTLNELRLVPIDIPRATMVDRIASAVSVLGASSTLRWGIYGDDGDGPGSLIVDTGAVGDASGTGLKEATIEVALAARRYWLGVVVQTAACSLRCNSRISQRGIGIDSSTLPTILSNDSGMACLYQASVTGALPSTFASAGVRNQAAVISLRAA